MQMYSCLRDLVNNCVQISAAIFQITEYLTVDLTASKNDILTTNSNI